MELPFHERLWAKARKSKWFAFPLIILLFIWEALAHAFYTWFDEHLIKSAGPKASSALHWAINIRWTFALIVVVCYCLLVIAWALVAPFWPRALDIISLREGELVDYQQLVFGSRRWRRTPVQLLVFSGGRWHPQWAAELDDLKWRAKCQFGDDQTPVGNPLKIVAISSAARVSESTPELPSGVKRSEILNVRRSNAPPSQTAPGIYLGRTRNSIAQGWEQYTPRAGTVQSNDTISFRGAWENGWRYPREDGRGLASPVMLGLRFQPDGDVNFYSHFRGPAVLYFSSRFADWGVPEGQQEFRVPIPVSALTNKWHVLFIHLACVEQMLGRRLDVIERFSVRGNLTLSHVWCLERLEDLPTPFLADATVLRPPLKA